MTLFEKIVDLIGTETECADYRSTSAALRVYNFIRKYDAKKRSRNPMPLRMFCPAGHQHIDEGEWSDSRRPHKTHQCQVRVYGGPRNPLKQDGVICGREWTPANFPTVGVKELEEKA